MKTTRTTTNRDHWQATGAQYSDVWKTAARQRISERELRLITAHVPGAARTALDIGIGNGRILRALDAALPARATIAGIDQAQSMVTFCRALPFRHKTTLSVADISRLELPVSAGLDMITTIRVIKYNANWKEIVQLAAEKLNNDGVLVFTMPNRRSLNILGRCPVPHWRTTVAEIRKLLASSDLDEIALTGFSRIPDFLYQIPGKPVDLALAGLERLLALLLGKRLFQREFFVVCRKRVSAGGSGKKASARKAPAGAKRAAAQRVPKTSGKAVR